MDKVLFKAFGLNEYNEIDMDKISGSRYSMIKNLLKCGRCKPHRGCNRRRRSNNKRSWKNHRDSQYRIKSV